MRGSLAACKISFFSGNSIYVLSTSIQLSNNGILKEKSISGNIEISIKMAKPTDTEYFCTIYNSFPGEFMVSLVFFYIFVKSEKVVIVFFAKIICIIICILAFEWWNFCRDTNTDTAKHLIKKKQKNAKKIDETVWGVNTLLDRASESFERWREQRSNVLR